MHGGRMRKRNARACRYFIQMMRRFFLAAAVVCALSASVFGVETADARAHTFSAAEELFRLNRPAEAIPLFEELLDGADADPAAFVYLGVAYYQVGDYQKSLSVCVRGLARADTDHKVLAYNAGNSAYALGNYARADACYAIALKEDPAFSAAYLNRANAQLRQDLIQEARENYQAFIEREPESIQRPAIEQLIALLDEEIVRRENEKPELIAPESLAVENEAMHVPEAERMLPEDVALAPVVPEAAVVEERVDAGEFAAPALPPEELTLADDMSERVVAESDLPPEDEARTDAAEADIAETVVREVQQDMLEAEAAFRRAREAERTVEEAVEIPVLPDARLLPPDTPRPLEKVSEAGIPAPGDAK